MTVKNKALLSVGISALALTFVVAGFSSSSLNNSKLNKTSGLDHYTLTLDKNNAPSGLTSSFQDSVVGTYTTADGNNIKMNFVKAKSSSNNHVELGSRGMIYNYASEQGGVSGISAITVTYSGSAMGLRTSLANALSNGAALESSYTLTSGARLELPSPRYFSILAADGGNTITSISIEYTCEVNDTITRLDGEYSGTGDDGVRYSLVLNNGSVTFKSLDNRTAITATGTATLNGNSLSCSFTSPSNLNGLVYSFNADSQSHSLTFVSKSGTGSADVPQISLYRVYNVEDFEDYSSRGNGWDTGSQKASSKYTVTGVRGDYICEYSGSGSTGPIGGNGWLLMGSTDYLNFSTNKGRNDSKCIAVKGNTNTMRYIQASAYYGIPRIAGKGNKLSFWSKGAFSNEAMSSASTLCSNVTVYAFYTQQVTSATFNQRTEHEFVIANNNDWTEYTMDLDPNRTYYSIGFMTKNHDGTAKYLPLDDFMIYTSSPYEMDLTETIAGNYRGYGTYSGGQHLILLSLGSHGQSYIELAGENKSTTATYTIVNGNQIKIVTSGVRKIGTFTGNYNRLTKTITNGSFTGTITNQINNNGSITLSEIPNSWLCDQDTASLRSTFKRRYMPSGGSWQVDNDNDDRIVSISYASISNGRAMRRRGYTGGAVSIALANDISSPVNAANIFFWVYNPSNTDITIRTWVYKAANYSSGVEIQGKVNVAAANKWTFIQIGYDKANIYNFQIADFSNSGTALAFANIAVY